MYTLLSRKRATGRLRIASRVWTASKIFSANDVLVCDRQGPDWRVGLKSYNHPEVKALANLYIHMTIHQKHETFEGTRRRSGTNICHCLWEELVLRGQRHCVNHYYPSVAASLVGSVFS